MRQAVLGKDKGKEKITAEKQDVLMISEHWELMSAFANTKRKKTHYHDQSFLNKSKVKSTIIANVCGTALHC